MKKLITTCCVAVTLLMPVAMTSTAQAEPERHPEIHDAIRALQAARLHMFEAKNDYGGHKAEAIRACDEAIKQLQLAIKFDNSK